MDNFFAGIWSSPDEKTQSTVKLSRAARFRWGESGSLPGWQASSGISGNLGLECANKANISWRLLYYTSILLGIQAAIEAGLGISALAINTALSILTTNDLH
jgi:hypothetical protein